MNFIMYQIDWKHKRQQQEMSDYNDYCDYMINDDYIYYDTMLYERIF